MLFGSGSSKFQSGATTVLLEHSLIEPDYCIRNISTTTSVYDHYHTYDFHGDYSEFTVQLNLFKYDSPVDKYNEVYNYLYTNVYFWPHVDGVAISGSNNEGMLFFIDEMKHKYLFNDEAMAEQDVLYIHFKSLSYTSVSGSIV